MIASAACFRGRVAKAEFQSLLDFVGNTPQLRADNLRHSDEATNCTYNYNICNASKVDFTGDDTYGFGAVAWPLQSEQVRMPGFADHYASFWTTEKLSSKYNQEYGTTTYYGYILYVDLERAAVEKVAVDRQYFVTEHNVRCIKD